MELISFAQSIIFSLAIGALMGTERQHSKKQEIIGLRTFSLISVLGCLLGIFSRPDFLDSPWLVITGFLTISALTIIFYRRSQKKYEEIGLTTAIAMILAFVLGTFVAFGRITEVVFVTIAVTFVLFAKERLHALIRNITHKELLDILEITALVGILYPLIPKEPLTLGKILIDLQSIWFLIVLISIVHLIGFIGSRFLSEKKSVEAISFLGGLVSTKAVFANLIRLYRKDRKTIKLISSGFIMSASTALLRGAVLIGIFIPASLVFLGPPAVISSILFAGIALTRKTGKKPIIKVKSPFGVEKAAILAIKIGVLLLFLGAIKAYLPSGSFYIASFLGGVFSAAATVASIATLAKTGQIMMKEAIYATGLTIGAQLAIAPFIISFWLGETKPVKKIMPYLLLGTAVFGVTLAGTLMLFS